MDLQEASSMLKHAIGGLLLLTLTACATPPKRPYQEPQAGPAAHVTFRNATAGRGEVAVFDNAAACTGRRYLPDLLIGEQRAVRVPGGEPLAFGVRYLVPNTTPPRYCEVLASFETVPDGRYEVTIRAGNESRPCTAHVRQLQGGSADRALQVLLRAPVKSRDEDGPFCYPIK
jgi:hypothetical protein